MKPIILIFTAIVCFAVAVVLFFVIPKNDDNNNKNLNKNIKTQKSNDNDNIKFNICSPLNHALDGPTTTPSPTAERSQDIVSWIRAASEEFLGYGTRVAGATNKGRRKAMRFIRDALQCIVNETTTTSSTKKWKLWQDKFSQNTVIGPKEFTNYILESEPDEVSASETEKQKHLVIAAHYDSKLFKDFEFVGACDSAIPIVMMLRLARHVAAFHSTGAATSSKTKFTFLFLDGEEAFVDWQGDDNTYGSRHLADIYERNGKLKSISTFMLLDLLGPKNPTFYNHFHSHGDKTASDQFLRMQRIEQRQRDVNRMRATAAPSSFFSPRPHGGGVDDDHKPWMQRGVPILHLIPLPFPPEWHKAGDTIETIDFDETVLDLYNIIAEYTLTF